MLAYNVHGDGDLSNALSIVSAAIPTQMSPLTISEDGLNVRISWLQPDSNGLPISGY